MDEAVDWAIEMLRLGYENIQDIVVSKAKEWLKQYGVGINLFE